MENPLLPNDFNQDIESVQYRVLNTKYKKIIFYIFSLIIFLILFNFFFLSAPGDFPVGAVVKIEPKMSLRSISSILEKKHIIRSRVAFESLMIIVGAELHVQPANYSFDEKLSVFGVVGYISLKNHQIGRVSVTIPEGFNINQIGDVFVSKLINFNKEQFLLEAKNMEGYLFPDTYFFLNNSSEKSVLQVMNDNFKKKITPFLPEITLSRKTEKDIIIMASIIEKESNGNTDREVISGILWKRISIGMPLQVDAAPETYKTKGLPENPIGNPGLLAIRSAIYPQSSPYLYYLHDKKGNIHYAKNFTEHIKNKLKYLK